MVDNKTYIKLYRKLLKNDIFMQKPFDDFRAFVYLLLVARVTPTELELRTGETIKIKRGQHFESRESLADKFGWSYKKVRAWEERLTKEGMIATEGTRRGQIYTVKNFNKYQDLLGQSESQKGATRIGKKGQSEIAEISTVQGVKNDHEGQSESTKKGNQNRKKGQRKKNVIKNVIKYNNKNIIKRERGYPSRSQFGKFGNVLLTKEEHEEITGTYEQAKKLIDKVDRYLENSDRTYKNHFALILKIAEEDGWKKKAKEQTAEYKPKKLTKEEQVLADKARDEAMRKVAELAGRYKQ